MKNSPFPEMDPKIYFSKIRKSFETRLSPLFNLETRRYLTAAQGLN